MSYPGDEGRRDGWPEPPPRSPYDTGPRRPDPEGHDQTAAFPRYADQPNTGHPYADQPHADQPHADQPHAERPYADQPYAERPYAERPYADQPYAERPYTDRSHADPYGAGPQADPYGAEPYADRYAAEPHADTNAADLPRGRGRRRRAARTRQGRSPLIVGGAIVAGTVLMAAGMGISSLLKDDAKTPAANAPTAPPSPTATGSPSKRPVLGNSRTTDPVPLTLREIFRHRAFTVGRKRYTMTVWRADRLCTRTVHGTTLMTALRRGSCSQVMRATFASADGKLIGTVGVANLRTSTAAKAAARLWNVEDAWLRPVPGPGITRKIGTGSALGTFQNKGHYLLMTWVQQPNGKAIPTAQRKLASNFGQSVMLGSGLYEALNYRGTEGKPLQS